MTVEEADAAAPAAKPASVWRNPDFVKLWGSENISLLGSQVTSLAVPFVAIILLHAGAAQVGILASARYLPYLLVSLPVGVLIDRVQRRPLMIIANVLRAALLLAIPVEHVMGVLRIEHMYVISFLVGILTVLFDLSWQSYLPSVVTRDQLNAANSQLIASSYAVQVGGPGLAGILVQALTAPLAIVVDAASFVLGALGLATIRRPEKPPPPASHRDIPREIAEGFRIVIGNRYLRTIGIEAACSNMASNFFQVALLLYLINTLHFTPAMLGFLVAGGSVGAMVGGFITDRLNRRYAFGPMIAGSMVAGCAFPLLFAIPVAGATVALPLFIVALAGNGFGMAMSSVLVLTLRQAVTPAAALGRMNAVYRMIVTGFIPVGSLIGGFVVQATSPRTGMVVSVILWALAPLWVVLSSVRTLKAVPETPAA
jgi:MFS family permease